MTDTGPNSGPLFVSSGDLVSDRRYKAAVELAARGPASPPRGLHLAPFATGSAIAAAPWRRFVRRAAPIQTIITARGCSSYASAPARERRR